MTLRIRSDLRKRLLFVAFSLEKLAEVDGLESLRSVKSVLRRSQNLLQEAVNAYQVGNLERASGWSGRLAGAFQDGVDLAKTAETTFAGKSQQAAQRLKSIAKEPRRAPDSNSTRIIPQ